jgi:hypothetical protein
MEGCKYITDGSVIALPQYCKQLRHIDVSFCSNVKPSTIENVLKLRMISLKTIGMRGIHIAECLRDFDDYDKTSTPVPPPLPSRRY